MNCGNCVGEGLCRNHRVIIETVSKEETVEKESIEDFSVKKTFGGKLIGVKKNEIKTLDKED